MIEHDGIHIKSEEFYRFAEFYKNEHEGYPSAVTLLAALLKSYGGHMHIYDFELPINPEIHVKRDGNGYVLKCR